MINALSGFINEILKFFYNITGDYGLSIILLTLLVNIVTFPLTRKQMQSSKKMQEIQPQLKRIQEQYKHDKEKLNTATMELMQKNKINPMGGCLPLLIQFPIIISVFNLLKDPTRIIEAISGFDPTFLFFPWDLTSIISEGGASYYILPAISAAATFFHQKAIITDPDQKMMLYIFPIMILVISVNFPAGLVLYWITNSLFSIGNHFIINSAKRDKKEKDKKQKASDGVAEEKEKEGQKVAELASEGDELAADDEKKVEDVIIADSNEKKKQASTKATRKKPKRKKKKK